MSGRALFVAALLLAAAGCGPGAEGPRRTLVVFAASSLTEAFSDLEHRFEAAHPGVDVVPSFAGSQVLRLQIEQGAPADVYASADPAHMEALAAAGLVHEARTFARNRLVVVVPVANPAGIERFEALPRARRLVVGTAEVPVGRYTRALLEDAAVRFGRAFADSVRAAVVSEETNVRLVLAKVVLGEADAAFVYATDAAASGAVRIVPVPEGLGPRAEYRIATVTGSAHPDLARAFRALLDSDEGRRVLSAHGFEPR